MNEIDPHAEFEKRSKALFDQSVEGLSGEVRSRLTQARHRALAEAGTRRSSRPVWIPIAGLATAAAVAALILIPQMKHAQEMAEPLASDDVALLLNGEDLALLEDIEFYAWLDSDLDEMDDSSSEANSDARS